MNEKKIIIYHQDKIYVDRLTNYINRQRERNLCAVSFTEQDNLEQYLQENPSEILLCEAKVADLARLRLMANKVFLLTENDEKAKQTGAVSRYSSAEELIKLMFSDAVGIKETTEYPRIIGVVNPEGSGTTDEFSIALAEKILAEKPVGASGLLLICFSPLTRPVGSEFEKNNMSELLFRLSDGAQTALKDFTVRLEGFDCISGFAHWADADEFTADNAETLKGLLEGSDYSHLILNFGGLHAFELPLFEACGKIYVPRRKAPEAAKTQSLLTPYLTELKRQLIFAGRENLVNKLEEELI